MADHTDTVLKVVEAVVAPLRALDKEFDVASVVKNVTVSVTGPGSFSIDVVSLGEVDQARFEEGVNKILNGSD